MGGLRGCWEGVAGSRRPWLCPVWPRFFGGSLLLSSAPLHNQRPTTPHLPGPCSAWSPPAYAALRDCTVAEAAAAAAAAGRLGALPVLLARHPRALLPSMLDVLGAVPETLEAKQSAPLLREVGWVGGREAATLGISRRAGVMVSPEGTRLESWACSSLNSNRRCCRLDALKLPCQPDMRLSHPSVHTPQVAALREAPPLPCQPDWVESGATAAELRAAGEYALLLGTEPMCAAGGGGGWHPPTQRQLARWVCERAQQVDASTGTGRLGGWGRPLHNSVNVTPHAQPSQSLPVSCNVLPSSCALQASWAMP